MKILFHCILYVEMTTCDICLLYLFMAIVLLCIRDCYTSYLQSHDEMYHCIVLISGQFFPPGSSLLHFLDCYNVFRPSCYPSDLTHQGASVLDDFTTLGMSCFYGLYMSLCKLFGPHFLSITLLLQIIPLRIPIYWYMRVTKLQIACTHSFIHYDRRTSGNVVKK